MHDEWSLVIHFFIVGPKRSWGRDAMDIKGILCIMYWGKIYVIDIVILSFVISLRNLNQIKSIENKLIWFT
jgi:hypothetical protein